MSSQGLSNHPQVKLADYVAGFLASQQITHVFAITGGASIHIIDSLGKRADIDYVCPHHEQAAAMAADGYARITGRIGAALATSGPGATNLITGIGCSWFDSVPVLYLTGQVTTFRLRGDTGVRQMGFQETPIVEMVAPITKYAVQVLDPLRIRYELEKAVHIARSGRPGPVVVDIPDDLQRMMIDPADLVGFDAAAEASALSPADQPPPPVPAAVLDQIVALIQGAERPVLMLGWGVRLAHAEDAVRALVEKLGFPVCASWATLDMLPHDHPLMVGSVGTHGSRYGNFTVQNADLVLALGARLSTRETGSPMSSWARGAKTIIVDIDPAELGKFPHFGKPLDLAVCADAGRFAEALLARLADVALPGRPDWHDRVRDWKARYPAVPAAYWQEGPVNPYVFVELLSRHAAADECIMADTGCTIAWLAQAFQFRGSQRLFHAFNNTPMGYALPGAIGAAFACPDRPVSCVAGDGSLMMNLQEFATIKRHRLPIRTFVLNNGGYSMVQQTQEQWLGGNYFATSYEGGLDFPDFVALARSFDIPAVVIERNADIEPVLKQVMAAQGPILCDVRIPREHRVIPQSRFGYPIEDSEPLLPRQEFLANMLVPPLPVSLG